MFLKKRAILLKALLSLGLAVAGLGIQSCQEEKPQEIRFGVITTLNGEYPYNGQSTLEGARLAVDQINQTGGLHIKGKKHQLVLIVEDNQDIPDIAVNAARKLIYQENVVAIVGPSKSRNAIPVANVVESVAVPMISPISTNPQTTAGKKYVFRATFTDDFQGKVMAQRR